MSILADFYTSDIVQDPKYKFSQSGIYYVPPKSAYDQYVEFIKVNSNTCKCMYRFHTIDPKSSPLIAGTSLIPDSRGFWHARQCGYF